MEEIAIQQGQGCERARFSSATSTSCAAWTGSSGAQHGPPRPWFGSRKGGTCATPGCFLRLRCTDRFPAGGRHDALIRRFRTRAADIRVAGLATVFAAALFPLLGCSVASQEVRPDDRLGHSPIPLQLGEWLVVVRSTKSAGSGCQCCSRNLVDFTRLGATDAVRPLGTPRGCAPRCQGADKAAASELQRARANARWGSVPRQIPGAMLRHESRHQSAIPREERERI